MTMSSRHKILYIVHDGQVYGSQQSLSLILHHIQDIVPIISIARPGPLNDQLSSIAGITLLQHQRLQWVKHDRRSWLQHLGDVFTLLVNLPKRVLALKRVIQTHHIQLVHTNSLVSLEGALAAKLAGIPHIWHIRELFMLENPKLHLTLGRTLTRWIISQFSDRVLCISKAVQAQFPKSPQYHLLYNALSSQSIQPTPIENDRPECCIGYAGRLSEGKRFHDLLDALALLRDQGQAPLPTLRVAGTFVDKPYEARIHAQLQTLGLAEQVTFSGYINPLNNFLKTIDILVIPSLNEPFGRVVIEAMAAGVPCIGADSGGIPEIITHNETGWLYTPKNPQALAQVLIAAMQDRTKRRQIQKNALRMVGERFTIEQQVNHLLRIYQEVLQ